MKKQHCMANLLTFFLNKNISIHFTMGKKKKKKTLHIQLLSTGGV